MERYVQISTADVFQMIQEENFKNIYFKINGELVRADNYKHSLNSFTTMKWFRREVIE